ncbi:MAG: helix-turn-helix domain-containing protein [Devosia sp.]|nr:helix-turn-helix domain-containing protein [Devosia sp.]
MHTVTTNKDLGSLIRAERKAQRLTQEQLAGVSGVGVRFVRELELGKESCQLGKALLVLSTLGLRVTIATRSEARP